MIHLNNKHASIVYNRLLTMLLKIPYRKKNLITRFSVKTNKITIQNQIVAPFHSKCKTVLKVENTKII